jgi:hypothetical protein
MIGLGALAATLVLVVAGCGDQSAPNTDPDQVDALTPPELGACRVLTVEDIAAPSNATIAVPCTEKHNAETFLVEEFPAGQDDYESEDLGAHVYERCNQAFMNFLTGDESSVMRTVLTWGWWRPSEAAWDDGARWFRCDVLGGGEQSKRLVELPETALGLLEGKPKDKWLVCVDAPTVDSGPKIPCTEPHTWRAVTTIKLGQPEDPYPGDRLSEVRTRDFCSDSVGAWLGYPPVYDYGYTWFHEAEWKAGNRRAVCWAKTAA